MVEQGTNQPDKNQKIPLFFFFKMHFLSFEYLNDPVAGHRSGILSVKKSSISKSKPIISLVSWVCWDLPYIWLSSIDKTYMEPMLLQEFWDTLKEVLYTGVQVILNFLYTFKTDRKKYWWNTVKSLQNTNISRGKQRQENWFLL